MKFAYFTGDGIVKKEFSSICELKRLIWELKCEYPDMDKASLDEFVQQRVREHLGDDYSCPNCVPENCEGEFCRCESRNIRIAKLNREMLKDNRAEERNEF